MNQKEPLASDAAGRAGCRIALDAMGGDHAPREIVAGALLAAKEYSVEIVLVGQEEVVRKELAALTEHTPRGIEVVDAREVVEMADSALTPIRKKRNSSVRVCAGFIGNVVLKAGEALGEFVSKTLKQEMMATLPRKIGGLLAKSAFDDLKKRMDYSEYGGAPLLGVKGGCIVCHGRSNAKAIKNAIRVARDFAVNRIGEKIQAKISDLHKREHSSQVLID